MSEVPSGWRARWNAMDRGAQGAVLVTGGSLGLVLMGMMVKLLGTRIPTLEILFFRSLLGLFLVLPLFFRNPMEPLRTKRQGLHFIRGALGFLGNSMLFWTLTHMLLADAMALQFSRPLFLIPLAVLLLGEVVGWRRGMVTLVGFFGILIYARPFTAGFDPGVFVGAAGALSSAFVLIVIKRLSATESTPCIMFYYAFWTALLSFIPTVWLWVTPDWYEAFLLLLVGVFGMLGQWMITHGYALGEPTAIAPLDYMRIVYSAVLGYLVFGELPGVWSFAGMALIVASSLYLVLNEAKRRRDSVTAPPASPDP